jgi:hypothetical protein
VITKEVVSFALVNDDNEIDRIPLCEVSCVDEMIGTEELEEEDRDRRISTERKCSHNSKGRIEGGVGSDRNITSSLIGNAFQIATDTNGYNSGRSYYLQAASASQKQEIIAHLQVFAKSARKRAEVKSYFRKTQDRVQMFYISRQFQTTAALLIVAVQ